MKQRLELDAKLTLNKNESGKSCFAGWFSLLVLYFVDTINNEAGALPGDTSRGIIPLKLL